MATRTPSEQPSKDTSEERVETAGRGDGASIDRIVESLVDERTADLEEDLEAVRHQVEELDDFARISLNERKIKQTETNLAEFSDSLTQFAEKAFNNINTLEDRLDLQGLLLAAMLDSLAEEDVEVDLSDVERLQQESVVMTASPDERLSDAIDRH